MALFCAVAFSIGYCMKNSIQLILLLLLPVCGFARDGFVIKGKITGIKNGTVAVLPAASDTEDSEGGKLELSEPVRIVNGEFTYFGKVDRPRVVKLKISTRFVNVFLENAYYEINCSLDSLHGSKLTGGTLNGQYWAFVGAGHGDMVADIRKVAHTEIGPGLPIHLPATERT